MIVSCDSVRPDSDVYECILLEPDKVCEILLEDYRRNRCDTHKLPDKLWTGIYLRDWKAILFVSSTLLYSTSSSSSELRQKNIFFLGKMQGGFHAIASHGNILKNAILRHVRVVTPAMQPFMFARHESTSAAQMEEHGFESTTISDILKAKGKGADGSWLWCTTEDTVYDAVKSMTNHNVGALVVVKPGEQNAIAGIITERDYLRKIIVQGRSSRSTKVGDIMTEENKLITVTPNTKVLKAMQLMTDNRIRHIPVVDNKGMIGMVSIGDVVRAVVSEHRNELDRLNAYIQGGY